MPKNFKKLLVCISVTFGITAFVFSCCKKIGLAASSEDSSIAFNPPPLLYGGSIGMAENFNDSLVLNVLDDAINRNGSYSSGEPVLVVPYNSGNNLAVLFPDPTPNIGNYDSQFVVHYGFSVAYSSNGSFISTTSNAYFAITTPLVYETINGISYYKSAISDYPIYVYNAENYLDSNGNQIFSDSTIPIGPNGHSKGGVLSNYIDSDDLIEDTSDLPKVDTSAPSNSSSIPDWLQKILNGIGRLNQSIQGGVLTIGDYISSMTEKIGEWFQNTIDSIDGFFGRVEDKLDDVIDSIEDLFDGTTVSQAQTVWQQEFNNSVFKDFVDLKSTIETDILNPIKNANAPSTLSFTIPLISVNVPRLINNGGHVSTATNNVYLFGQSVTLDFSWYTRSISGGVFNGSSIRDYLVPIIATFLYVGMVVHLLFKIPSFLSGSSGFSNTLHSVVVSNNGSKFKKA